MKPALGLTHLIPCNFGSDTVSHHGLIIRSSGKIHRRAGIGGMCACKKK